MHPSPHSKPYLGRFIRFRRTHDGDQWTERGHETVTHAVTLAIDYRWWIKLTLAHKTIDYTIDHWCHEFGVGIWRLVSCRSRWGHAVRWFSWIISAHNFMSSTTRFIMNSWLNVAAFTVEVVCVIFSSNFCIHWAPSIVHWLAIGLLGKMHCRQLSAARRYHTITIRDAILTCAQKLT